MRKNMARLVAKANLAYAPHPRERGSGYRGAQPQIYSFSKKPSGSLTYPMYSTYT